MKDLLFRERTCTTSAIALIVLAVSLVLVPVACTPLDGDIYTLYRSSVTSADLRIHVATYDADEGEAYNRENCQIGAELFQSQPGVKVRYWCEKGRFRP